MIIRFCAGAAGVLAALVRSRSGAGRSNDGRLRLWRGGLFPTLHQHHLPRWRQRQPKRRQWPLSAPRRRPPPPTRRSAPPAALSTLSRRDAQEKDDQEDGVQAQVQAQEEAGDGVAAVEP